MLEIKLSKFFTQAPFLLASEVSSSGLYRPKRYGNIGSTYRHVYRAEPKEPTQFGSVSGSEIQNLPFSHSGIVSLYRSEPKEPP